jgi:hypothetical protein
MEQALSCLGEVQLLKPTISERLFRLLKFGGQGPNLPLAFRACSAHGQARFQALMRVARGPVLMAF